MQIRTSSGKIECVLTEMEAQDIGAGLSLLHMQTRSMTVKERLWAMRSAIISSAALVSSNNLHGE